MPDTKLLPVRYQYAVERIALEICQRSQREGRTCPEIWAGEPAKYCPVCKCKWAMEGGEIGWKLSFVASAQITANGLSAM